tara:strand:- start:4226 stop:4678 length:453 start_codon:yes stop_codon:yes gene_type:complete
MALAKKFLGLDLATKTGWAHTDGAGGTINLANKEKNRGQMAAQFDKTIRIILKEHDTSHIVCELPPVGLMGNARLILLGLFWQAQHIAYDFDKPFIPVNVTKVKKWATGSGKASKEEMMDAAIQLKWMEPVDDNHADAMLICKWGEATIE